MRNSPIIAHAMKTVEYSLQKSIQMSEKTW